MSPFARRVAIVKLSALGDVVHALPVATALKMARPAARVTWIVERREAAILRGHTAIDEIIDVDTRGWRRARAPAEVRALGATLRALRRRLARAGFDAAVDLQGLVKSGVLTAATRAPLRVGFTPGRCREPLSALFTNRRVRPPAAALHVVDQNLALLGPVGIVPGQVRFDVPIDAAAEARIEEWLGLVGLKARQRLVVINPGAGRATKRWPRERFRALGERLVGESGADVVVVWGPEERQDAEEIAAVAGAVVAPPTDVAALVALLRRASVVVGADTGPLHLAAAAGTPCVGLYGPTRAERNGPYGEGHATLQSPDGTMTAIDVAAVQAAVAERLGG